MKLGLSQVHRKLNKMFGTSRDEEYVLNEEGQVVAKRIEKQYLQFFVKTADGVKLLVLAKGLKRKFGQNLNVTSVATLFEFDGVRLAQFVKNRAFVLTEDSVIQTHGIFAIGSAEESERELHIVCEKFGIDEVLTEHSTLEDGQVIYIISEKEKTIKGEKEE